MVRDLTEYINPEEHVDTPNLGTVFIIIPKHQQKEWLNTYENMLHDEHLEGGVVPGSATVVVEDTDNVLYSIIIFKRLLNDFKVEARKKEILQCESLLTNLIPYPLAKKNKRNLKVKDKNKRKT